MPIQIRWDLSVEAEGSKVALGDALSVEGFDKIEVKIPGAGATVNLQPSDDVQFLLLTSNLYSDKLTYDVGGGGASKVKLDAPQLLMGAGAVGLLGKPPKTLSFTNDLPGTPKPEPTVLILIGREATP